MRIGVSISGPYTTPFAVERGIQAELNRRADLARREAMERQWEKGTLVNAHELANWAMWNDREAEHTAGAILPGSPEDSDGYREFRARVEAAQKLMDEIENGAFS